MTFELRLNNPVRSLEESADVLGGIEDGTELETALAAVADTDIEVQTDRAEGRRRHISAKITIPQPIEQVWQVLTDYDHLADFIPNLAESRRLSQSGDRVQIEQIGTQSLLKFKFCARVVLEMVEQFPHQIQFQMLEGDFKEFSGTWQLQAVAHEGCPAATVLSYQVAVLPSLAMPIGLIERRLKSSLVVNLAAIRQQAHVLFGESKS